MNTIQLQCILKDALDEDLGFGDMSSSAIFEDDHFSTGTFTSRAAGVLAGLPILAAAYRLIDDSTEVELFYSDGDAILKEAEIARVKGRTSTLLQAERVILNLLQHLGGIATATKRAIDALDDSSIRVCDTRKTLPGLRMLQKYAVRCGGGYNHRYRLDDGVMIKDNHIKAAGSITDAIRKVRDYTGLTVRIEVETENRQQVLEAVEAGADIIMFDNRSPQEVSEMAALVPPHIITEISGGVTTGNIAGYKNTGVDYISLGSLTHSVTALDISFNLE